MNDQRSNFLRAVSIVNTLLIFIFILFLVEKLNSSFLLKFGFIYVFLITGALKVYFLSGIGGCVLDIISMEEPVVLIRRFNRNAKNLWPGFLIAFVIILLADFIFFALLPKFRVWRPLFFSFAETFAALILAQWSINKKYLTETSGPGAPILKSEQVPSRKVNFDSNFLIVIISAFLLEIMLVMFSGFIHIGKFQSAGAVVFIVNYIRIFEFVLCSVYIFEAYPDIIQKFSSQKEIFLVYPMGSGIFQSLGSWFFRGHPPFFVVLRALTPKTYKFREFNRVLWHERYYKSKVLVCITCFTSNCYEAYKIAKSFKKRGATVIMGGPHVTYLPDEALAFCDSVVVGQAEGVWAYVMRDYENGELKSKYSGTASEGDYSQVYEELINSPPYVVKDFLETIRGCKFRCHFCTIPAISNGQVRPQPANLFAQLVKKVRPYYSQLSFIDNNIYSDPGYAKELFMALKPLKIKWKSACTIDIAKNRETLKLARESGCDELLIGYEISGVSLEKDQGGKFAMAQKYLEYTKIIKKAGIKIKGGFIYGFDSDNLVTLFQLWKFCFSIMPMYTSLSVLTPLPGSGVYKDMLLQDRIINLNWRNYTATTTMVVSHPRLNPALVSCFFPLVQLLFFMTTCSFGLMFLVVLLFFPRYGIAFSLF